MISAMVFIFLPLLSSIAGDNTSKQREVAVWISSSTPGLPLDLSAHTYLSLLMDSRYSLVWAERSTYVEDAAPAAMSTFVRAYPPGISREQHLATYQSNGANSNQLLSDPLNLGDIVAAHFATIASAYGGLDIDIENFDRIYISAYATFLRCLRSRVGAEVGISVTAQISWSREPEVLALLSDGTADAMNVMYYDYHGPWTAPGPIAPYDSVQRGLDGLLATGAPAEKVRLGLPSYHYDWRTDVSYPSRETTLGGSLADALGKAAKIATASQSVSAGQVVDVTLQLTTQRAWNATTEEITFEYRDSAGDPRVVYSPTATSAAFKLDLAASRGLNGVAVWNYRHLSTDTPFQDALLQYRTDGWVAADDPVPSDFFYWWSASGGTLSETVTDGTGVQWTAPLDAGSYTVTVSTSDGSGLTDESSVTFTVTP